MRSDSKLVSVIESFPVPASFKEADTGKYIVNNAANAQQFGVSNPTDLIGLTIHDLTKFVRPEFGIPHADWVAELDFHVREKKVVGTKEHSFLDIHGEVQYQETVKFPVLGTRQNIIGIVSYSQDRTETISPSDLYRLYRHFYAPQEAIRRVLACLDVAACFLVPPTDTQFQVFLAKAERYANKQIARFLGISYRTVECHLDALRNKVIEGDLRRALSRVKHTSCTKTEFEATSCT